MDCWKSGIFETFDWNSKKRVCIGFHSDYWVLLVTFLIIKILSISLQLLTYIHCIINKNIPGKEESRRKSEMIALLISVKEITNKVFIVIHIEIVLLE